MVSLIKALFEICILRNRISSSLSSWARCCTDNKLSLINDPVAFGVADDKSDIPKVNGHR